MRTIVDDNARKALKTEPHPGPKKIMPKQMSRVKSQEHRLSSQSAEKIEEVNSGRVVKQVIRSSETKINRLGDD